MKDAVAKNWTLPIVGGRVYSDPANQPGGGGGELLDLGELPNRAVFRSRLASGHARLGILQTPGSDANAGMTITRQANTGYVVGEIVYEGNFAFRATTTGTTAAGGVTFDTSTVQSQDGSTPGAITIDGGVEWECVYDVNEWYGDGGWTGQSRTYRVTFDGPDSLWYYDTAETAYRYIEYGERTGILDSDTIDWLDTLATVATSNYLQKGLTQGSPGAGYHVFSGGMYRNLIRTGYKYAPLVTLEIMENIAASGSGYANFASGHWVMTEDWDFAWNENSSREIAYLGLAHVYYAKANADEYLQVSCGGVTDNPMRWIIPSLLNHMWQWMNGVEYEPNGFAPFMFALNAITLIEWYEYELSVGRDPDRFTSSANIGSISQGFSWSHTAPSGISRAWTSIPVALEDFLYWLRHTAVNGSAQAMFRSSNSLGRPDYRYRTHEEDPSNIDLNALIAMPFMWMADYLRTHAGVTAWEAIDFAEHADDLWGNGVGVYYFDTDYTAASGFHGKQWNEWNKPSFMYVDFRNRATGRND